MSTLGDKVPWGETPSCFEIKNKVIQGCDYLSFQPTGAITTGIRLRGMMSIVDLGSVFLILLFMLSYLKKIVREIDGTPEKSNCVPITRHNRKLQSQHRSAYSITREMDSMSNTRVLITVADSFIR